MATPKGFFKSSRGLRQSDHFSLLSFVFVMEIFSKMILDIMEGGFLSGFLVGDAIMAHLTYLIYYLLMIP